MKAKHLTSVEVGEAIEAEDLIGAPKGALQLISLKCNTLSLPLLWCTITHLQHLRPVQLQHLHSMALTALRAK